MNKITFHNNPINLSGKAPEVGNIVPPFSLINLDLTEINLTTFKEKRKILNIFPSIDTGVCATSVERFEEVLSDKNALVLNISRDTPFALKRFSDDKKITRSQFGSDLSHQFGKDYGLEIISPPLTYLLARTVIILDEENRVIYIEQVPEITQAPDFKKVVAVLES